MGRDICQLDWKVVKLRELGEINRGRSKHRPRYAPHLYGGPYPFIQTGDIRASGGRITRHSQTYSDAGLAQSRLWPAGTLCITIAANIAETAILTYPACFPDSIVGFLPNPKICDVRFIEYMFRLMRRDIQFQATGSVQNNINLATLEQLTFPSPPLKEQVIIADFLSALDDKIELNRRINQTLEAMARAIFKSWFVDSEHQDNAFLDSPSGREDSAKQIPKGWSWGKLGDVAVNQRRIINPSTIPPDAPYIGLEHMPRKTIALSEWGRTDGVESSKFAFKAKDILFGKLRPYFHKVGVAAVDGVCSTDILVLSPKSHAYWGLVLFLVSSDDFVQYTDRASAGTKMPRTNWTDMARYEIVVPPENIARAFAEVVEPMVDKINANIIESRNLAAIRDALLPKLLSGEIRVKGAEKVVGEVV